ncbi:amino acid ABC transporter permease [Aquabacter cavernae]|uniref:amino acid ABC transporter permease n=1 Tax=Aquabacter cavernae TaxID=2496029 RepID=UPI000F8DA74C|nr:amino acid ABC transporter permease [Aquabacter cavernae]
MTDARLPDSAPARRWSWTDPALRSAVIQVSLAILLIWMAWSFFANAQANLARQGIASGFGFLDNSAGFGITQTLIPYSESMSYGRAFLVGLLNTLLVAVLGIILATVIGFLVGVARLSENVVIRALASAYVEVTRNLPPLFQILFWYLAVLATMPNPRQGWAFGLQPLLQSLANGAASIGLSPLADGLRSLAGDVSGPGVFLSNRGLVVPRPVFEADFNIIFGVLVVGIIAAWIVKRWAHVRREKTGQPFPTFWVGLALVLGPAIIAGFVLGWPMTFEKPELRGFNFAGGVRIIPEFVALLVALSVYTAGFIAEIVRAGILAVSKGQTEAAKSLGMRSGPTMRLIIIPQAMRVIVPPLTSQYLNLTKNSTLGVAVGYPDLFAVFAGTTLNQTGQAIEIIAMTMAVYLTISILTSMLMGWYNKRVALVER